MEEVLLESNLGTEEAKDEEGLSRDAISLLSRRNSRHPAEDRFGCLEEEDDEEDWGWRFSESRKISSSS